MLPDVVIGCLAQAMDGKAPAEGASSLWNPMILGGHGLVGDADYGKATPFAVNLFHAGGTGARGAKDGLSATAFPSGVRNTPVEINEVVAPLLIKRKEYRCDSGGAGRYRGGLGQIMEIAHIEKAPFAISAMFDRCLHPPRGRLGGETGMLGRLRLGGGGALKGKGRQAIPRGESAVMEMPGGGGIGDPRERSLEAVARDLRDGLISPEAARDRYGVMLDRHGKIDTAASARLRARSQPNSGASRGAVLGLGA